MGWRPAPAALSAVVGSIFLRVLPRLCRGPPALNVDFQMILSAPVRMRLKGLLGEAVWPFPAGLAAQCLIRKDQGLVLTFHYIGSPVLGGVGEDLFLPLTEIRRALDFVAARLRPLPPLQFFRRLREGSLPERATV